MVLRPKSKSMMENEDMSRPETDTKCIESRDDCHTLVFALHGCAPVIMSNLSVPATSPVHLQKGEGPNAVRVKDLNLSSSLNVSFEQPTNLLEFGHYQNSH